MGANQVKENVDANASAVDISSVPVPVQLSIDMSEQELAAASRAAKDKRFAGLKSQYKPSEENKNVNLIEVINNEDYDHVNLGNAARLPITVQKQITTYQEYEALRNCFPVEKAMARCLQDKMWTAWKCQKERDTYYKCLEDKRVNKVLQSDLRWKYSAGTFHGEFVARGNIMKTLWRDYFPSRDMPHQWVEE